MASAIRQLRGSAAENDAKAFPSGVITVDETNHDIRVHDGTTLGGHPLRSGAANGLIDGLPIAAPAPQPDDLLQFNGAAWVNIAPVIITDGGNF